MNSSLTLRSSENNLPSYDSFFSKLKNEKTLETDYNHFLKNGGVGYDANALFMYAIGANVPCGPFSTYKLNDEGVLQSNRHPLQVAERGFVAFCTQQHLERSPNCKILSRFSAKVAKVVKYIPDACCNQCKVIWEFLGCFHHAHDSVTNLVRIIALVGNYNFTFSFCFSHPPSLGEVLRKFMSMTKNAKLTYYREV